MTYLKRSAAGLVVVFLAASWLFVNAESVLAANAKVQKAQQVLTELGYQPGPADGLFGRKTSEALKKYQKDNNLPITGQIDGPTAKALGVSQYVPAKREKEDKGGVTLSYSRLPTYYQERDENGILGPPAARVNYAANVKKDVTVAATAIGVTKVCPLVYQDVAYILDKEGKRGRRIPIFGYQGCPFVIQGDLEVTKNFEMRDQISIEIEKATDSILWVSSKSALPLASTGTSLATGCDMFINTTWVFKSKGMVFAAKGKKYITEKDGATIKFTKTGVIMDGVSKKK